jgi:hypothetical protein
MEEGKNVVFIVFVVVVLFPESRIEIEVLMELEDNGVKTLSVVVVEIGEGDLGLEMGVGVITSLLGIGDSMNGIGDCCPLPDGELFLAETLRTVSLSCDRCR